VSAPAAPPRHRAGRRGALLMLSLAVASCAIRPTVPGTDVAWERRAGELATLEQWLLRGRIGVRTPDGGSQGRLQWRQAGDAAELRLSGPFGAGGFEIRWDPGSVTVTDGDGEVAAAYTGPAALDRFVAARLGWTFPAGNARYWLLGVPAPDAPHRQVFDADGWLAAIEQDGWRIEYDGFQRHGDDWLPRKLSLASDAGRVRVVVDSFRRAGRG